MPSIKMPTPRKRPNSQYYWLRKKVPDRYRPLVGKTEVWKSLETTDLKTAIGRCVAAATALDADWARLAAESRGSNPASEFDPVRLTHQDLLALRGVAHVRIRDAYKAEPPTGFAALRIAHRDPEDLEDEAREFLKKEGFDASDDNVERFVPLLARARWDAVADLKRAAKDGDYSDNPDLAKLPPLTTPALDFVKSFEEYVSKGGLKGGKHGPTAKRWRPKIKAFCAWLGHRDLKRMTSSNAYDWVDNLIEKGFARESISKVWIASLSATAGFMVERRKLNQNPFIRIKVRPEDVSKTAEAEVLNLKPRPKGYTLEEAEKILTATVATPSHLISVEMRAARRWLPWLCAYSGARVNELTSLYAHDIASDKVSGIWCMIIKPSLEKTKGWRTVPIHSHVVDQGFLDYVEERRKLGKPLFYDPDRGRGGKPGNPQFKKVAERVGDWVRTVAGIPVGLQPNHAWRHLFKSVARHVTKDREVEGFITGHRPKNSNAGHDYGDRWVTTMSAEIEKYPRFDIAALKAAPAQHRRVRRTNSEVAAAKAAKEARKMTRATRAA